VARGSGAASTSTFVLARECACSTHGATTVSLCSHPLLSATANSCLCFALCGCKSRMLVSRAFSSPPEAALAHT